MFLPVWDEIRICSAYKFSDDADAADLGTTLGITTELNKGPVRGTKKGFGEPYSGLVCKIWECSRKYS